MSAAAHTPGPWHTPARKHGTRYVEARIGCGLLQEVAACGPTEVPEQQEANARLIAAAPDMLAALKAIVLWIPSTSASEGGAASHSENVRAADMVRAAIAKAVTA